MILDRRCRRLSELDVALTANRHESPQATLASVVPQPAGFSNRLNVEIV
jgi:hypothetical protein